MGDFNSTPESSPIKVIKNEFLPERPKNLKIKKRKYTLSRWRRRRLSRVN